MIKPIKLDTNNFLSSLDLSRKDVINILELAEKFKNRYEIILEPLTPKLIVNKIITALGLFLITILSHLQF